MVTGDNALTARAVAEQVGIPGSACSSEKLHGDLLGDALDRGMFAGVFPEDKILRRPRLGEAPAVCVAGVAMKRRLERMTGVGASRGLQHDMDTAAARDRR